MRYLFIVGILLLLSFKPVEKVTFVKRVDSDKECIETILRKSREGYRVVSVIQYKYDDISVNILYFLIVMEK